MRGGRLPSLENMASNGEGLVKEREKASQKDQDVYGRGEGGSGENMTARRQRRARGKQAKGQHATPRRDMTRSPGIRHRALSHEPRWTDPRRTHLTLRAGVDARTWNLTTFPVLVQALSRIRNSVTVRSGMRTSIRIALASCPSSPATSQVASSRAE